MLTPAQLKKLEKLAKVLDGGDIELLAQLNELDEKLEAVASQIPALRQAVDGERGEDGRDGEDYILTAQDKREIASTITVPVVEKIIEKTIVREVPGETIIREIPIVTNEIKEVATLDDAIVGYLEDEIKRVEELIPEVIEQKETNFGFVIRDVVAGNGVTIDKRDPNRPILSLVPNNAISPYRATSTATVITATDYTINCTANTFTVTLPTAVGISGRIYHIKNSGHGVITVTGSESIDDLLLHTLNNKDSMQVQSTGTNWIII